MRSRGVRVRLHGVIRLEILLGLVTLCLFIYCLINVIQTPQDEVRNLSKTIWILLVLFFPFVGSIAWLIAGRPENVRRSAPYERSVPQFPEYDRPGRAAAADPAGDEEFLRQVRERAEEQRRQAKQKPPADEA
jgi:hypothetical protein